MTIRHPQKDLRHQIHFPDLNCSFSVWKRVRIGEVLVIRTNDLETAISTLEGLAGKKKFAYLYYFYKGSLHFLCCTLDGRWSRTDYRESVKRLLRKSRNYSNRGSLWSGKRSLT